MMTRLSKMWVVFALAGAVFGISGCDGSQKPIPKPEIVHKKITAKPADGKPVAASGAAASSGEAPSSPKASGEEPAHAGSGAEPLPSDHPKPSLGEMTAATVSYNPTGKIDPFVPLFKEEPVKTPQSGTKREKREPSTPLEMVDLSQLKLTAVLRSPSGLRAMVEDPAGKGYIIGIGTYIGTHSGKVVKIMKDRIVVEEEIEDALGHIVNQDTELKFQKPSGD